MDRWISEKYVKNNFGNKDVPIRSSLMNDNAMLTRKRSSMMVKEEVSFY